MFRPFKSAELWWNARTPVWLHNGTKENLLFQLGAAAIICAGMMIYDEIEERRNFPEMHRLRKEAKKERKK